MTIPNASSWTRRLSLFSQALYHILQALVRCRRLWMPIGLWVSIFISLVLSEMRTSFFFSPPEAVSRISMVVVSALPVGPLSRCLSEWITAQGSFRCAQETNWFRTNEELLYFYLFSLVYFVVSEFLDFWTLSVGRYSKKQRTQHFGNWRRLLCWVT
jgi:hypothetical protein